MRCPRCHDEYEDHVSRCAGCGIPLVPDDEPLPPQVDALLGTFHPVVAGRIEQLLAHRRIAYETVPANGTIEILVDREYRDDLRAELALNFGQLLAAIPPEEREAVNADGGRQPGWFDAPQGAWVDRSGRIQVEPADTEELDADARRVVGPSLLTVGAVLLVFGWYAGSAVAVLTGIALVAIGLFLPR